MFISNVYVHAYRLLTYGNGCGYWYIIIMLAIRCDGFKQQAPFVSKTLATLYAYIHRCRVNHLI